MRLDLQRGCGGGQDVSDELEGLLGRNVVLDTAASVVYLGKLVSCGPAGFWLEEADVHNTDDGHAPREQYILESVRQGIRANRLRVFVLRQTVISVSALDDVVKY
jgi:hypothetical protein